MCFKVISNDKGKKGQNDPSLTSSKETNSTNSLSSGDQKGNNAATTKNTQSEKASKPFTPFKPDISKDEKISSFKQVKVYYFDNQQTNSAKAMIEEPTIFQLESFRPKTQMIQKHNLITNNKTCTCTKTKCLKKYCECLANNQFCYNCNCVDCHNIPAYQSAKLNDDIEIITCTCTKSNCNKKYCECYKAGKKCNYNCRCLNCLNKSQGEVEQKKDTMVIERISVLINKGAILVDKQTLSTDFTAISQKRSRTLFHTDNINHKES